MTNLEWMSKNQIQSCEIHIARRDDVIWDVWVRNRLASEFTMPYGTTIVEVFEHWLDSERDEVAPKTHKTWQISSDGYYTYCPECGYETGELTKYCPHCGTQLGD